jgi:hypothetical protein
LQTPERAFNFDIDQAGIICLAAEKRESTLKEGPLAIATHAKVGLHPASPTMRGEF